MIPTTNQQPVESWASLYSEINATLFTVSHGTPNLVRVARYKCYIQYQVTPWKRARKYHSHTSCYSLCLYCVSWGLTRFIIYNIDLSDLCILVVDKYGHRTNMLDKDVLLSPSGCPIGYTVQSASQFSLQHINTKIGEGVWSPLSICVAVCKHAASKSHEQYFSET